MAPDRYDDGGKRDAGRREPDLFDTLETAPQRDSAKDSTTDELRYEGPIRFDEETVEPVRSESGSGRTVVTAAIISGAVIIIIGIALFLRTPTPAEDPLALLAEPPPLDAPLPGEAGAALDAEDGAGMEPAPAGALRPVPSAPARQAEEAAPRTSPPPPPPPARPEPRPARDLAPAPPAPRTAAARIESGSAASDAAVSSVTEGLKELIEAGRYGDAARMARERAQFAPDGSWTLQVLFACQPATVETAFREAGGRKLMLFEVDQSGTSCYRLTWGVFPSRDAAVAQTSQVPARFRSERPLPIALDRAAGL